MTAGNRDEHQPAHTLQSVQSEKKGDPSPEIDALLDDIGQALEADAEQFVKDFVQGPGNGGLQFQVLVERIYDSFGERATVELRDLISSRDFSSDPYALLEAIESRIGLDIANYLEPVLLYPENFAQVLNAFIVEHIPQERLTEEYKALIAEETALLRSLRADEPNALDNLRKFVETHRDEAIGGSLASDYAFIVEPDVYEQVKNNDSRVQWLMELVRVVTNPQTIVRDENAEITTLDLKQDDGSLDLGAGERSVIDSLSIVAEGQSAQSLGAALEDAFVRLLRRLFAIAQETEESVLSTLRKQTSGLQFGLDLKVDAAVRQFPRTTCHIECKNYRSTVTLETVAAKIISTLHHWRDAKIDHLIFISPHKDPSNELENMVQTWNNTDLFPFVVQIWSPQNGIERLFAIEPSVHEELYGRAPAALDTDEIHQVVSEWTNRMAPVARIPKSWRTYLRNPDAHCIGSEDRDHFRALLADHVEFRAADDRGVPLQKSLGDAILEWLNGAGRKASLLLAEFGDGKSFFTYLLSRHLSQEYLDDPSSGVIPIRFSLGDLGGVRDARELLDRRLSEIGSDVGEWGRLAEANRILVILDGFDEMSVNMSEPVLTANVRKLGKCYEYLTRQTNVRVLVTSRTSYLEERIDQEHLLESLGRPAIFRMAPVSRARRLTYLAEYAKAHDASEKLGRLKDLYDPIGLAAKPLFLEMIKVTLLALPEDQFDEVQLYKTYVHESLKWNKFSLDDEEPPVKEADLVQNLVAILEDVAVLLHVSERDWVSLREIGNDASLSERLWKNARSTPFVGAGEDNLQRRIGVRSLLKPDVDADPDQWPVKFFHRSMGEYFVARAIVRDLRIDVLNDALIKTPLKPEVAYFAARILKTLDASEAEQVATRLLSAVQSHSVSMERGYQGGNALTLLYESEGRLPHRKWDGLRLDYAFLAGADLSHMSFEGSSLRHANLDNTNLSYANLSGADLTGVRLEETSTVMATAARPELNGVYCAYDDRSIKEWRVVFGGRPAVETIISDVGIDVNRVFVSPYGDLIVVGLPEVHVYANLKAGWSRIASIRANRNILDLARGGGDRVILRRTRREWSECEVYDLLLKKLATRFATDLEFDGDVLCPFPGMVVIGDWRGVFIFTFNGEDFFNEQMLDVGDVSAVASFGDSESAPPVAHIAVGQRSGTLSIYSVRLGEESEYSVAEVCAHQAHRSRVAPLIFVGDSYVVSASSDRSVLLFPLRQDLSLGDPQQLQLAIQCDGLVFDGVAGPSEAAMLAQLVTKAQSNRAK